MPMNNSSTPALMYHASIENSDFEKRLFTLDEDIIDVTLTIP
jgi:hypothetical protein